MCYEKSALTICFRMFYSGAAGACAGRPKVLGASAGEAGIEAGDPPKKP